MPPFARPLQIFATIFCFLVSATLAEDASKQPVSFDIDVEVVLAKAGCNAGACHGNQNGKGGFQLSLRGQDPTFDYAALVRQNGGRRVDLLDPDNSLLLLKPTMQLAHQGGKRLTRNGPLYHLLRQWIATGAAPPTGSVEVERLIVHPQEAILFAPQSETAITVEAQFSDGTRRDVTAHAVYEPSNLNVSVSPGGVVQREASGEATIVVRYLDQQQPVRVAFLDAADEFRWSERVARNYVDEFVFAKLKKFRSNPAERCSDHVFLRRAWLDLLGTVPPADEAERFVADANPNKRDELIESLLSRPEFADHWSLKWADLLRVEENVLDRKGVEVFHGWIRDSIQAGKPMDQFVSDLLLARGSTYDNPPANYFRALRETSVRGEAAARVFLGTRLQCAQCHNHPFDRWTQDDYYSWSSLFARIDYEIIENKRKDKLDKNQFVGEQLVKLSDAGEVINPTSGKKMSPRFLGDDTSIPQDVDPLGELAEWLTSGENRQFARAQVNRIWFHLMGTGLVNPVDDFRVTNPASHPELLERLASEFVESGFRIRPVIREIMRSESYQLSSSVADVADRYARVAPRRLAAEQLLDAQAAALAAKLKFNGYDAGTRASQLAGVHKVRDRDEKPSAADRFLFAFGKPERLMTCECERSDSTTLSQALLLINGECIDDLLKQPDNLIGQLIAEDAGIDSAVTKLYLSALSRAPSSEELHNSRSIVAGSVDRRRGLEDVAWALLNAKEFVFRH